MDLLQLSPPKKQQKKPMNLNRMFMDDCSPILNAPLKIKEKRITKQKKKEESKVQDGFSV